ncbi:MAG: hypothetical protein WBQ94_04350 [Terracidiphilus sp.]
MGADRITTNMQDAQYDSPGALVANPSTGLLAVVTQGGLVTAATRLLNVAQQTALTAITTAQTLLSKAMPAGSLNVAGRTLRVRGALIYSTTIANVATITIALKLGSVTLCTITTAATNTAASTNLPIQFDFTLTVAATGAAATIQSHGTVSANIGTAAAGAITVYADTNTAVSSAVDLTIAETLAVTIAASAAVPSAQLLSASVDLIA